jgi:hypothetical protein
MTRNQVAVRFVWGLGLLWGLGSLATNASLAAANQSLPPILQTGFVAWGKSGADLALDAWQKGGLLEGDNKVSLQSRFFRRLDRAIGNYRAYETLETKPLGQNSQIVYVSIDFEHGAVYGRFHLYRSNRGWVVQNMDFSVKPESIMPWLTFEGAKYEE